MTASDVRTWFARRSGALFVAGFGLVFAIAGVLILVLGTASVREHARVVRGLPAVTAENLARFPAATPVLAEGRIAPETAAAFRDFVAFTRQQFRGWKEAAAGVMSRVRRFAATKRIDGPKLAPAHPDSIETGQVHGGEIAIVPRNFIILPMSDIDFSREKFALFDRASGKIRARNESSFEMKALNAHVQSGAVSRPQLKR